MQGDLSEGGEHDKGKKKGQAERKEEEEEEVVSEQWRGRGMW